MLLLVSGSPHPQSANSKLLLGIGKLQERATETAEYLAELPVFQPGLDKAPWPASVLRWRSDVARAEAVVISTPAYLHNLPGVLKNALDWLASSGEFTSKPTLVFTFTPAPPRGDRARQSLLWSLEALDARVVAEGPVYQKDISFDEGGSIVSGDELEMIREVMLFL